MEDAIKNGSSSRLDVAESASLVWTPRPSECRKPDSPGRPPGNCKPFRTCVCKAGLRASWRNQSDGDASCNLVRNNSIQATRGAPERLDAVSALVVSTHTYKQASVHSCICEANDQTWAALSIMHIGNLIGACAKEVGIRSP